MWRDYFKMGIIVGLDLEPCHVADLTGRIRFYRGDQQDIALLRHIAGEVAPNGFDIIIDDCSHIGEFTSKSFWYLFMNHLKQGGLYIIEDWGTGYWDNWFDGKRYKKKRSSIFYLFCSVLEKMTGVLLNHPGGHNWLSQISKLKYYKQRLCSHDYGMVGFVKQLVDEAGAGDITHPEWGIKPYRPSIFSRMTILHGQVIIVKSRPL
jgi:hypothetical protein